MRNKDNKDGDCIRRLKETKKEKKKRTTFLVIQTKQLSFKKDVCPFIYICVLATAGRMICEKDSPYGDNAATAAPF